MSDLMFVVPLDQSTGSAVRIEEHVPSVVETVTVRNFTPTPPAADQWGGPDLRDYVVARILEVHGVFPRNETRELSIFGAFTARWGVHGPQIARYAFERLGGYWKNAPVSVARFAQRSDPYFAMPILHLLQS